MTRAKRLLELQEIDLKRDDLGARLVRIVAALRDDRAVVAARTALVQAEADVADVDHRLRQATLERETVHAHVVREEQQLYAGRVKAAKDVQNLQREVVALKRQLDHLDDAVLELMIQHDERAGQVQMARAALDDAVAATTARHDTLARKQAAVTRELQRLNDEREALVRTVPVPECELYERLRATKGGRAVADLRDAACSACGMLLPSHDVGRIQTGDGHVFCPTCGRLVLG